MHCTSFPGPGDRHIYTFNPMAEFIHPTTTSHVDFEFDKFKNKHNKVYNDIEHEHRKELFRQNARFIYAVNRQTKGKMSFILKYSNFKIIVILGYTLAINHLADKTDLELKALRGRRYSGVPNGGVPFPYKSIDSRALPNMFDWRIFGAVTPVKGIFLFR